LGWWERAEALAVLCPLLPASEKAAVVREALIGALAVADEGDRAKSLAALAPELAEVHLVELRDAARRAEGTGAKLDILIALAKRLATGRPDEALLVWNDVLSIASKGVRSDLRTGSEITSRFHGLAGRAR